MSKKNGTKKKKKKSGWVSTLIMFLVLIVGLSVLLYPTLSDYWNTYHETKVMLQYQEAVAEMSDEDYDELFAQADAYNEELRNLSFPFEDYEEIWDDYIACLDVSGTGVIGTISIPCIDVELPIYHGTSSDVLNKAAGHLEGTTLPVGGESTHAVISAHRGLPTAKLFTDLDKVIEGDQFTITVLNRVLTYEVYKVEIVLPDEIQSLNITRGEDEVTLITCTPYGINTHRLLVHAKRVATEDDTVIYVPADGAEIDSVLVTAVVALPMLLLLLIFLLVHYRRKPTEEEKNRKKNKKSKKSKKAKKPDPEKEKPENPEPAKQEAEAEAPPLHNQGGDPE